MGSYVYVSGVHDQLEVRDCKVPNNTEILNWTCPDLFLNMILHYLKGGLYDILTCLELVIAFSLTKFEYA